MHISFRILAPYYESESVDVALTFPLEANDVLDFVRNTARIATAAWHTHAVFTHPQLSDDFGSVVILPCWLAASGKTVLVVDAILRSSKASLPTTTRARSPEGRLSRSSRRCQLFLSRSTLLEGRTPCAVRTPSRRSWVAWSKYFQLAAVWPGQQPSRNDCPDLRTGTRMCHTQDIGDERMLPFKVKMLSASTRCSGTRISRPSMLQRASLTGRVTRSGSERRRADHSVCIGKGAACTRSSRSSSSSSTPRRSTAL